MMQTVERRERRGRRGGGKEGGGAGVQYKTREQRYLER